jgi:hypothetical protein
MATKGANDAGKESVMSGHKRDDIAKGHMTIPSRKPLPGAEDKPIDAGKADAADHGKEKSEKDSKISQAEP